MLINKELFKWQNILFILVVAIVVHFLFGRWTSGKPAAHGDTTPTAAAQ